MENIIVKRYKAKSLIWVIIVLFVLDILEVINLCSNLVKLGEAEDLIIKEDISFSIFLNILLIFLFTFIGLVSLIRFIKNNKNPNNLMEFNNETRTVKINTLNNKDLEISIDQLYSFTRNFGNDFLLVITIIMDNGRRKNIPLGWTNDVNELYNLFEQSKSNIKHRG